MAKNYKVIGIENFDRFANELAKIPEKSEKIVNDYLHRWDVKASVEINIRNKIPVSQIVNKKYKNKVREHAKFGDSLKIVDMNLGFLVTNEKYYQYLIFPNLGVGKSRTNPSLNFVEQGIESDVPKIEKGLEEEIIKELTKSEFFN